MPTPEMLRHLLLTVQCLKVELAGSDAEKVGQARKAYRKLLDQFHEDCRDMALPQQYDAAGSDPDHFLLLIKLVLFREADKKGGTLQEKSEPYFNWKLFTQI